MDCSQIDLYEFLAESELQHYYNAIKNELKITNAAQFKYASDEDLKNIGLSRPEIRRLRKFYEKYFPHGYLSKIKRLLQAPATIVARRDDSNSTVPSLHVNVSEELTSEKMSNSPNKVPNNKHIIPADTITVNKQLGTGEFGIVQQGVWTNGTDRIQVAIKCLCRERMQSNPMEFLKEAAIMHSIEHENIVRLYGVVLATDSLMLVTELAHLRSLLECLKDAGLRLSFLTVPTLCKFAEQICNGMRYLENKRLIHRDLAARNILVFSKDKVKISDFGLSRALGVGKDYYKTNFNVNLKLPIAWCAPECINYLRFTNASDVWAFGVCLWEMFSYGFQPWAALTGLQILEAIDAPNYQRLEQPDCCPREYYTLMMKCWQDDALKRPKFSEIYEILPEIKPDQLKAVANYFESKKDHLIYRQGDIITVLDRNTGTPYWKGVLISGKTGFFNPSNTVAFLEFLPNCNSRDSFCRINERSSKRKLRTEMISKPQNDFKHTGHVGIDGASFGDIAFLANTQNYNHVPHQIVTPYKPSEDIEQTPLLLPLTPTSPDSLQTASGYFPEQSNITSLSSKSKSSKEITPMQFSNMTNRSPFEFPSQQSSKNVSDVTSITNPFPYSNESDQHDGTLSLQYSNTCFPVDRDEDRFTQHPSLLPAAHWDTFGKNNAENDQHEYHEISDDDEIIAEKLDFGPSLLDEINSMFGSMNATLNHSKSPDFEQANAKTEDASLKLVRKSSSNSDSNGNKFSVSSSKKKSSGTVKPISIKDEKILNQAIEIANEMSARSMNDLVSDQSYTHQSPKRKFSFRFPHISSNGNSEKANANNSPTSSGAGNNSCHLKSLSPYSKKKNFTEELKSIPDLQPFQSLNEFQLNNNSDIRIPLFDKESSDFCFKKSREILSRPLSLNPTPLKPTQSAEKCDLVTQHKKPEYIIEKDHKSITENIIDIENTLKALNLDFMHTYNELDKTDSDETLLNDKFSCIVSSLDEEISSVNSSLRSTANLYKDEVETMFDFNAATSHLNKHLQYINKQTQNDSFQDQKQCEEKRSSTPDTGFASRDTNISLSRRSSQKSSYSPQENHFSPKEINFVSTGYAGLKEEVSSIFPEIFRKHNITSAAPNKNGQSTQLKLDCKKLKEVLYNQHSTSYNDSINQASSEFSETQQRFNRRSKNIYQCKQYVSNKPRRSVRARTLRRLSYNPIILNTSSSSGEDSECNNHIARSEYDIPSRVSSLYRYRNHPRTLLSSRHDKPESMSQSQRKLYGSNTSIKSAPHYNYDARRISRNYTRNVIDQYPHDKSHEHGSRVSDNICNTKNTGGVSSKNRKGFSANVVCTGSGSGSSSGTSLAIPFGKCDDFQEFDVTKLTGKSPTSNFLDSPSNERNSGYSNPAIPTLLPLQLQNAASNTITTNTSKQQQQQSKFHWPEKIHASTVKENDLIWRRNQKSKTQTMFLNSVHTNKLDSSGSSSTDSNELEFRADFINHIPPSPAP